MKKRMGMAALAWLLCGILALACLAESEGGSGMTDFARRALTILGVDEERLSENQLRPSEERTAQMAEALEEYLQRKYPGVDFALKNILPAGLDQTYTEFQLVQAEVEEDIRARVQLMETRTDIADDYYCYIKNADYEAFLAEKFGDLEEGLRAISTIYCLLDLGYDAEYPVAEAADDAAFFAYVWFLLPPSERPFEERMAAIEKRVRELGLSGDFKAFALIKPLPEDATRQDVLKLIPAHSADAPVYSDTGVFVQRGRG